MEYVAKERMGGLYNAVPHNSISKYELLKLFNKYLRDNSVTINPVEGIVADKSLVPSKLGTILRYRIMNRWLRKWHYG